MSRGLPACEPGPDRPRELLPKAGRVGAPGRCSFKPPPHRVPGALEAGEGGWKRCGQAWLAATKPCAHQNRPTGDALNPDTCGPSRPCARGPVTQRGPPDTWRFVRSNSACVSSGPWFRTLCVPCVLSGAQLGVSGAPGRKSRRHSTTAAKASPGCPGRCVQSTAPPPPTSLDR
jgi:hypothetical protein